MFLDLYLFLTSYKKKDNNNKFYAAQPTTVLGVPSNKLVSYFQSFSHHVNPFGKNTLDKLKLMINPKYQFNSNIII
ncbi:hypothetical protein BpHYR1_034151 [Brachionus plicatilis]|uniref:Uncharacterized protein n=1 Tax=Brachionus plicatilis TaxID=10195 RepID=A0A3M7S6P7_BRAPC|nr:hypothetical protein BpHYR1_034151 [Brachionus plicatilis]